MSITVEEIEKEIADIKAANPGYVTNEVIMKYLAALTEMQLEKLRLARMLPFILFSAVFY